MARCSPSDSSGSWFVVEDVPTISFKGTMFIQAPGGVLMNGLDFDLGSALFFTGIVQRTAVRMKSVVGVGCTIAGRGGAVMMDAGNASGFHQEPIFALPAGVLPCGSCFDGTSALLNFGTTGGSVKAISECTYIAESSSYLNMLFRNDTGLVIVRWAGLCSQTGCQIVFSRTYANLFSLVQTASVDILGTGSVMSMSLGCIWSITNLATNGVGAGKRLLDADNCRGGIWNWIGVNAAAGVPLQTFRDASVQLVTQPTVSGGVAGQEVIVGANAVNSWANAFGGLAANSTDIAAASPQLCRVGP